MSTSLFDRIQYFDAFGKTLDDFRIRTRSGALVTIVSAIIMIILLISEFRDYLRVDIQPQLMVDPTRKERLRIHLNMTLPKIPCYLIGLHLMDMTGEEQLDTSHSIFKLRLSKEGKIIEDELTNPNGMMVPDKNYCGDCYGGEPPENGCCNTCEEVKEAYLRRGWSLNQPEKIEQCVREGWVDRMNSEEGCRIYGHLNVRKVAGNFHFALGRTFQSDSSVHIHDLEPFLNRKFDFAP
jgi:hypothetical protein